MIKYLASSILNLSLTRHITLIPNKQLVNTLASKTINFGQPGLDVLE